jgi:TRAP-type C4-dicarboxylate transport system substrate-binding protein
LIHKRYNQELAQLTNGKVQTRVFWGGTAGDERTVLRKMRIGQIDASPLSLEIMSQAVRQALVLASPGLFLNYNQLDAAIAEFGTEFSEEAWSNGFKVIAWGDIGRLRLFSKERIYSIADFKRIRPWLYPESQLLAEFYRVIGATGIPLDVTEVFGGLQTNMIDTVWATSLLAMALQWHRSTHFVSREPLGFISGAFVFRRTLWEHLTPEHRGAFEFLTRRDARKSQLEIRQADQDIYERLLTRGHTALDARNREEWVAMGEKLRKRMIGRIYTQEIVTRAERISAAHRTR